MAAGKPVLGILEEGTEARLIVEESGCGLLAEPGEYDDIRSIIRRFIESRNDECIRLMGQKGREYLEKNLTKEISISRYAKEIMEI